MDRSRSQAPLVALLATVVVMLGAGCEIGTPSVPDEDDELDGVIGNSSDNPFPPGEQRLTGTVLMLPADRLDELFVDHVVGRSLERGRPLPEATQSVEFPAQRIREAADIRTDELRRGRFSFDQVEPGTVALCLLDEAPDSAPPDSVLIRGCDDVEAEPPMSVKLMLNHGTLGVIETTRDD